MRWHKILNDFEIEIVEELVDLFIQRDISEEFIKKLICSIREKMFPILFQDQDKNIIYPNIELKCNLQIFPTKEIDRIINTIPKNNITEFGAVGFILAYIVLTRPDIQTVGVYNIGEGLDYHWREADNLYKLEISGCNTENRQIFLNRIWQKKNKFKKRYYGELAYERLIGIVDFYHERYKLWTIE